MKHFKSQFHALQPVKRTKQKLIHIATMDPGGKVCFIMAREDNIGGRL
jgi:hypothetical protein